MGGMVRISVDEFGGGEFTGGMFSGGVDSSADIHEDVHLRACVDDGADTALRERADVLYFDRAVSADEVAAQLDVYPGCVVCVGASADGAIALAVRVGGGGPGRIAGTIALGGGKDGGGAGRVAGTIALGGGGEGGGSGRIEGRVVEISGLFGGADDLGVTGADCALIASLVHALLTRVAGGPPRAASPLPPPPRTGLRVPLRERLPDWPGR